MQLSYPKFQKRRISAHVKRGEDGVQQPKRSSRRAFYERKMGNIPFKLVLANDDSG